MKFKKFKAFSLIEVSIIILIIGILIAGITTADKMMSKFRLATAKSLAISSPINSIQETALWLETALDNSFDPSETNDGYEITSWKDQKKTSTNKVAVSCSSAGCPTYANTINRIHAVKFDNAGFLEFDGSFLNNTDYTISILEKRLSPKSNNYFFGKPTSGSNDGLLLGYQDDGTVIHKQGSSSYNKDATVVGYSSSEGKARLFTFTHSSTDGNKIYINGTLAAEDPTKTDHLSGVGTLSIGEGYEGEIAEIAIFTKSLKKSTIASVEKYVGKKMRRKVNTVGTPTCLDGAVTDKGCDRSLARCNLVANGISASVAPASDPTNINCNLNHFDNSIQISYTCVNGEASIISGSCSCATGYSVESSECNYCAPGYESFGSGSSLVCTAAAGCDINTTNAAGITPVSVSHGESGTLNCDAFGYNGNPGPTYSCNNGTVTIGGTACLCKDGYGGTNCSSCASGYIGSGSGSSLVCTVAAGCNITTTNAAGITPISVSSGTTGTLNCGAAGYDGNPGPTYSCNNGTITISGSSCKCASGYYASGGSCLQKCDVLVSGNSVKGFASGTQVERGTNQILNCNDTSGHFNTSDTINYTCGAGNSFSIVSGACDTCEDTYYYDSTSGTCKQNLICTGGVISTVGNRKVHKFIGNGTFACTSGDSTTNLNYLGVGSGGNGASGRMFVEYKSGNLKWYQRGGGGGGGGQVSYVTGQTLAAGDRYNITVGTGASAITNVSGSIASVTFAKGGNGGGGANGASNGGNGGAGGNAGGGGGGGGTTGGNAGSGNPSGSRGSSGATSAGGGSGGGGGLTNNITGSNVSYGKSGRGGNASSVSPNSNGSADNNGSGGGGGGGGTSSPVPAHNTGRSNPGETGKKGVVIFSYPYY
jgi:type II secretory pathway pseudopilin PulG